MQSKLLDSIKYYKLREICQTNSESYSENEKWDEAYYLDTGNITENKIKSLQHFDLGKKELPSRARRKVTDREIIYSTVRPIQKHYGIMKNPPYNLLVSTGFTTIKIKNEFCDSKYIYYYLIQEAITAYLQSLAEQAVSTYPSIRASDIEDLEIPLPPLPTQKKIASILSSLDDKIELNICINKVLEDIARAMFHRWFVEFEFPDAEGRPYKSSGGKMVESERGSVPEGWKVGTIGDVSTRIFSGGTPNTSKNEYWNGEFSWFSSGETRSNFVIDTEKKITKAGIENSSTKLAKKHDIVVASAGQGFTRGQISYFLLNAYVNQSVIVISSDIPIQTYLYVFLSDRYDELRSISDSNSIRGSLTTKIIAKFPLTIPPHDLIESFSKIMDSIIIKIENNLHENKRLKDIRNSLLPKLMSGEIELGNT